MPTFLNLVKDWKTSSGQGEMKRCFLSNIGKDSTVLLTSCVSRVKLHFSEVELQQALFRSMRSCFIDLYQVVANQKRFLAHLTREANMKAHS